MQMNPLSLDIIGGGLVGSLAALQLSKLGYGVRVFERRPDLRKSQSERGRSINLALSIRGLSALNTVGLGQKALEISIPMKGRRVHGLDGTENFLPYGKLASEVIYSISRSDLNQMLLDEAESQGASFLFQERLVDTDPAKKRLSFCNELTGKLHDVSTHFCLGTDGAASALRKAIAVDTSESYLDYGYKELSLPAGSQGFQLDQRALHIWPRQNFMLIALPNLDRSFTCTLFLPYRGEVSFERLDAPPAIENFFKIYFSDAQKLIPNLIHQFETNPTGNMVTVRAKKWHEGNHFLLMGDAAHAMVPFFGQGMNCGFEDVSIFIEKLLNLGLSEHLLCEFSEGRRPDTDAMAEMALENFIEMRDKVARPEFLFRKEVERLIEDAFDYYYSRYRLVTFTKTPYRVAREIGQLEDSILERLCYGLASPKEVDLIEARDLLAPVREKLSDLNRG